MGTFSLGIFFNITTKGNLYSVNSRRMGNKHSKQGKLSRDSTPFYDIPDQDPEANIFHYIVEEDPNEYFFQASLGAYFNTLPPELLWNIWEIVLRDIASSYNEIMHTVYQISLINRQFHKIARYQMSELAYRVACPWYDPSLHRKLCELSQTEQVCHKLQKTKSQYIL
jgi:hypothetical protein